jgi:hypothetical protein
MIDISDDTEVVAPRLHSRPKSSSTLRNYRTGAIASATIRPSSLHRRRQPTRVVLLPA